MRTTGLRTITAIINGVEQPAYTVEVVSSVKGTDFGLPQERPRTLFFGVRIDMSQTAEVVVKNFYKIAEAYKAAGGTACIDDFVTVRTTGRPAQQGQEPAGDVAEEMDAEGAASQLGDHIAYCQEFKKAVDGHRKKNSALRATLLPEDVRPSRHVPLATSRIKATIDAQYLVQEQHVAGCSKNQCRCHAVADVAKSSDHIPSKNDGTVPTLTTGSKIYSYKLGAFIHPQDLANSMGYSKINMAPFPLSAAERMTGNAYMVPVCTCALAAVCIATGHLVCRKNEQSKESR